MKPQLATFRNLSFSALIPPTAVSMSGPTALDSSNTTRTAITTTAEATIKPTKTSTGHQQEDPVLLSLRKANSPLVRLAVLARFILHTSTK